MAPSPKTPLKVGLIGCRQIARAQTVLACLQVEELDPPGVPPDRSKSRTFF